MPELLHEAITLIRADRLDDARQILFGIIRNDSQNEVAWIWLAETFSSDLDRLRVLNACKQNVPNNKIVNMAISKLKKKIDDTSVLSPGINPFLEGGTYDPTARERTGHTGAIIGFDGSFIVSEVPDFDGVIDLREPEQSSIGESFDFQTKPLPPMEEMPLLQTQPVSSVHIYEPNLRKFEGSHDTNQDAPAQPIAEEDLTLEHEYDVDPNIFLEPRPNQTGELNYEPDLSHFLSDEYVGKKQANIQPKKEEPISFELPNALNFNQQISAEKPKFYTPAPSVPPVKKEEPIPVVVQTPRAYTPIEQLRHENLENDPFLENNYGEEEKPKRKGIRRNVLLLSGLFTIIVMLCLITVVVLSGYSFDRSKVTPTFSAALINELNPATPKITLPPIVSPTPEASALPSETPAPTETPLPTETPTETPLLSSTPSNTPTRTSTPTRTRTGRPTATNRP
ncbi:MAG: hypothetical protein HGB14_08940, partial [Anaerolineaceae bacterium]|nr:hypothetical protein [Anaerolineaceae bacterium]